MATSMLGSSTIPGMSNPFNSEYIRNSLGANDSVIWPAIALIILLFVVVVVIYTIIRARRGRADKQVKEPITLYDPPSPIIFDREVIRKYMTANYSLSFYLQIDAVPDMRVSTSPLLTWPKMWDMAYNPSKEQMQWTFTSLTPPETITISNIPLQRWVQIVIVYEGRSVDLFINGTLVKSELLNNLPLSANSSIAIVPNNVMGRIAFAQIWSRRLSIPEVAANYIDTSDSQGRPYIDPAFLSAFTSVDLPNLFCPNGDCYGSVATCLQSQTWDFPYA